MENAKLFTAQIWEKIAAFNSVLRDLRLVRINLNADENESNHLDCMEIDSSPHTGKLQGIRSHTNRGRWKLFLHAVAIQIQRLIQDN